MVAFDCAPSLLSAGIGAPIAKRAGILTARQGNKIIMKVGAITGPRVAGKHRALARSMSSALRVTACSAIVLKV